MRVKYLTFFSGAILGLVVLGVFVLQYNTSSRFTTLASNTANSTINNSSTSVISNTFGKSVSSPKLTSGAGADSIKGLNAQNAQAVTYVDDFYTLLTKQDFTGLTKYVSNSVSNKSRVSQMYRNTYTNNSITLKSYNVFSIDSTLSTATTKVLLVHLDELSNGKEYKYTRKVEMNKDSDGKWRVSAVNPYTH